MLCTKALCRQLCSSLMLSTSSLKAKSMEQSPMEATLPCFLDYTPSPRVVAVSSGERLPFPELETPSVVVDTKGSQEAFVTGLPFCVLPSLPPEPFLGWRHLSGENAPSPAPTARLSSFSDVSKSQKKLVIFTARLKAPCCGPRGSINILTIIHPCVLLLGWGGAHTPLQPISLHCFIPPSHGDLAGSSPDNARFPFSGEV